MLYTLTPLRREMSERLQERLMTTSFRSLATALLCASLTAVLLAQAPALNVKMGLWEITTTAKVGGQPPAIDTSKMTPERKAQMEAAMQKMMGDRSSVAKTCVTREKFEKSNFLGSNDDPGCKRTITTNTATALDGTEVCTGERARTMHMHIEALSSTSWKGTTNITTTRNGRTTTVDGTLTAKWLGADCGDQK